MSRETGTATAAAPQDKDPEFVSPEVESYPGQIEWYRFADGNGRLYRLGLIELTDLAGRRFLGGANSHYRLVVLLDARGVGQAYPFKLGGEHEGGYLASEYVYEKLGQAVSGQRDARNVTRAIATLLHRPMLSSREEDTAG